MRNTGETKLCTPIFLEGITITEIGLLAMVELDYMRHDQLGKSARNSCSLGE